MQSRKDLLLLCTLLNGFECPASGLPVLNADVVECRQTRSSSDHLPARIKHFVKNIEKILGKTHGVGDLPSQVSQTELQARFKEAMKEKDLQKKRQILQRLSEQGYAEAQFELAMMYYKGAGGKKLLSEAHQLFGLAAVQGHTLAINNLGTMYERGEGGVKDLKEARRLFLIAAEHGNAEAQHNLANMYAAGKGGAVNEVEARRLFSLSAAQGHAPAQYNLGVMYDQGIAGPQDKTEARRLFGLSASQGSRDAQFALGLMEMRGEGGRRDILTARKRLSEAASAGVSEAKAALSELNDIFPDDHKKIITIERCCEPIQWGGKKLARFSDLDPYLTGSRERWDDISKRDRNISDFYRFKPLTDFSPKEIIPDRIAFRLPKRESHESDSKYFARRAKVYQRETGKNLTYAGSGSMSVVYYVHEKIPDDSVLISQTIDVPDQRILEMFSGSSLMEGRRKLWIQRESKEVVKFRRPNPFLGDQDDLELASRMAKQDLALHHLFKAMAHRFKEVDPTSGNERELVRPVAIHDEPSWISRGVFIQNTSQGETAFDVGNRVLKAEKGDKKEEDYLIGTLKFKSLEEAKRKIALLETFYAETHQDVRRFELYNQMEGVGAYMNGGTVSSGFDYNHGRNVIWNPKEGVFEAIDF